MAKTRSSILRPMEKLGLTVPEAIELLAWLRSIYKAIREGRLRIRKYSTHHHHAHRSGVLLGKYADER
jgi:hypothetical protein